MILGLLHPGNMGAAIGGRLAAAGHTVLWCPDRRSPDTRERATAAGLTAVEDLAELLRRADMVVSICPSAAAIDVAEMVAEHRFDGIYVEANAISPQQMQHIAALLAEHGASVVDAIISGPPPQDDNPTAKVFVAGARSACGAVCDLLATAGLPVDQLGDRLGAASALKMALIAYQRPARLLAAISHGLADQHGITDMLIAEANRIGTGFLDDRAALPGVAARAWRWVPEVEEAAISLSDVGLPADFVDAAAKLYRRFAADKDNWANSPEQVIERLMAIDDEK
jgi:3-hydroxyisobutyrate dehydrogenase-like beta-hydroxyacid dehydrogenase